MTSSITSLLQALHIMPATGGAGGAKLQAPHKTFPKNGGSGLPSGLPEITLAQVAQHDTYDDCWIVIYDRVYDVGPFLLSHPGGEDIIMDHAGRDATLAFHGTGHSADAIEQMRELLIGELPLKERIFRRAHGRVLSSGVPE